MFLDYVTLMLVNMAAGLVILACYVYWGLDDTDQARWSPAFGVTGFVATLTGLHMIWTWPLPGPFNSAFGELTVLFGVLFAAAAIAIYKGWNLIPLAIYAFFAGLAGLVVGARMIHLGLTMLPVLSGTGFILTGLGGIFALPTLHLRGNKSVRLIGAIVLLAAAGIWSMTAYPGIWMHMQSMSGWKPR